MTTHCEKCEELLEELAYYKGLLGEADYSAQIATLRAKLRIGNQPLKIIMLLYAREGRPMSVWELAEQAGLPEGSGTQGSDLGVRVHIARKALGGLQMIENCDRAYRLTPEGMERVRWFLSDDAPVPEKTPSEGYRSRAKLSEADVRMIRWLDWSPTEIAAVYDISTVMVWKIKTGRAYQWVENEPDHPPHKPRKYRRRQKTQAG